jgi:hypothetical protein
MSDESLMTALEKLTKWRKFFASWQLGTRADSDGESRAVRNHRELSILLRAEVSALIALLMRKGVFTQEEWLAALEAEAKQLDHAYEETYPGWRSTAEGLSMKMPEALETMRKLGFPP